MKEIRTLASICAFAAFLLAGCGSSGVGDIFGGGDGSSVPTSNSEIRGTVNRVDLSANYILLTDVDSTYGSYLSGGQNSVQLYFDSRTIVEYQGNTYRPQDLEAGDRIAATVDQSGSRLLANHVTVLYDVSSGSGYPSGGYSSTIRGTVDYVDARNRALQVDRAGYGTGSGLITIPYDTNTIVDYQGNRYRPEDLERGDVVDVAVRDLGGGQLLATRVVVIRSVSGGSAQTGQADLRGTVRFVDTRNRTIELEQTSWSSRFSTGTTGATTVVRYDASTQVIYQNQSYGPGNLERGDVIDVFVRDLGSSLLATRIVLVRDATPYG